MSCVMNYPTLYATLVAALATPALAHHSFAAFDMSKQVTLKGSVESVRLENPHMHMIVKVPEGTQAGRWDIEGASANIMRRQGWSATSFKAGDKITIVGHPLRSGDRGVSLFYAIRADGTRLYQDIARPKHDAQ
jgi:hypothetical protein